MATIGACEIGLHLVVARADMRLTIDRIRKMVSGTLAIAVRR